MVIVVGRTRSSPNHPPDRTHPPVRSTHPPAHWARAGRAADSYQYIPVAGNTGGVTTAEHELANATISSTACECAWAHSHSRRYHRPPGFLDGAEDDHGTRRHRRTTLHTIAVAWPSQSLLCTRSGNDRRRTEQMIKPKMKERYRKQKFLKNFGLQPNKTQRPVEEENDINICERVCFYYFDDDAQVVCRGCYKSFKTWLNFRLHFNTLSCHTTETNYKLNTYNDVYKKYKLKKAKTKKKINDRLSAAQLMDLETLNTRKTRKRCYQNTRVVVTASKSSSDSGSINSEKSTVKTLKKKEVIENYISSDESIEESKTKPNDYVAVEVKDIPSSTKTTIPKSPHDNQTTLTIKTEWNANDLSQASSDDHSSRSAHCPPKYSPKNDKALNYQYVCVICDAQFLSKCSLTMHQVQHIKSDRSSYSVFMAALTQSARV